MASYTVTPIGTGRWRVVQTPSRLARWFGAGVTVTDVYLDKGIFRVAPDGGRLESVPYGHSMIQAIRHRAVTPLPTAQAVVAAPPRTSQAPSDTPGTWPITVKTCRDCPLCIKQGCEMRRFSNDNLHTVGLDLTASLITGAPPPTGCPLMNGAMTVAIILHPDAWRCPACGRDRAACATPTACGR